MNLKPRNRLPQSVRPVLDGLEARLLLTVAFRPAVVYPVATGANSVATGDFNGDGKLDVVTETPQYNGSAQGGVITTLLGDGKGGFIGSFDTATPALSGNLAVGDFNGDGKLDVASTGVDASNNAIVIEFLGNGDGTFQLGATAPGFGVIDPSYPVPTRLVAGDFNGDGVSDLAVAYGAKLMSGPPPPFAQPGSPPPIGPVTGPVLAFLGERDGTLHAAGSAGDLGLSTAVAPGLVAGDFNGDGKLDLAGVTLNSTSEQTFLGNGDGTFRLGGTTPIGFASSSLVRADFNGDGKLDLAAVNQDDGSVIVLGGIGDGTFAAIPNAFVGFGAASGTLVAGDFNGDGKIDLAVPTYPLNEVRVAPGSGDGHFVTSAPIPVPSVGFNGASDLAAGDLNGDGLADLMTVTTNPAEVGILLTGTGSSDSGSSGGGSSGGGSSGGGSSGGGSSGGGSSGGGSSGSDSSGSGSSGSTPVSSDGPQITAATVQYARGQVLLTFSAPNGLDLASLTTVANYAVLGPFSSFGHKPVAITGVSVSGLDGTSRTVALTINGGRPLRHGRYVIVVHSGGIVDLAGKALDGEFTGKFPTGNAQPGGDFQGRFQFNRHPVLPMANSATVAKKATAHRITKQVRKAP